MKKLTIIASLILLSTAAQASSVMIMKEGELESWTQDERRKAQKQKAIAEAAKPAETPEPPAEEPVAEPAEQPEAPPEPETVESSQPEPAEPASTPEVMPDAEASEAAQEAAASDQ